MGRGALTTWNRGVDLDTAGISASDTHAVVGVRGWSNGGLHPGTGRQPVSAWSGDGGADPHARLATPNNPAESQPGDDWYSNEDEAQNDAVNEVLEALAEGKYSGDIDEFWEDLESIEEWEEASWREPDPPPAPYYNVGGECGHPASSLCADVAAGWRPALDSWLGVAKAVADFDCDPLGRWESTDGAEVLTRALAMLQANVDLVERACCVLFGPSSDACSCLIDYILGKKGDIRFCAERDAVPSSGENPCAEVSSAHWPRLDTIHVYDSFFVGGPTGCEDRHWFVLPDWLGTTAERRDCVLAVLAGLLAHELMHKCLDGEGDHGVPPWDYEWLDDASPWQQEHCDLSVLFAFDSSFDGAYSSENLTALLEQRYC